MNRINATLLAFALATAIISTSCVTLQKGFSASKEIPLDQKRVAFHVIGLMKTASGAT